MIVSTKHEGGITAGTSYTPSLGDITGATAAIFTPVGHGDATLSTASEGWADIGDGRARARLGNPVNGAAVKALQHQFAAADPATADPLVIVSDINTTFAGHLTLIVPDA